MEVAQNYENSAQSLRKSLKGSEERKRSKSGKQDQKDRRKRKHSDLSNTSSSSSSIAESSVMESFKSDLGPSTRKRAAQNRKGKENLKIKMEYDDQKQVMKSIHETLEAIKVNLAKS